MQEREKLNLMPSSFIWVAIGALLGLLIGWVMAVQEYRGRAIEHGAAYYAPDTGDFTWKEK